MNKTNSMETQVRQLADARRELSDAKQEEKDLKEEFRSIFDRAKQARKSVKEWDELVRHLAITLFSETGDPQPHESVKVIGKRTVFLNDEKAIKIWAVINNRFELLNLNVKAFEAIALAGSAPLGLLNEGHVTVNDNYPAVRIFTDLGLYETQVEPEGFIDDALDSEALLTEEPEPKPVLPVANEPQDGSGSIRTRTVKYTDDDIPF